jgi:hypothetical protein
MEGASDIFFAYDDDEHEKGGEGGRGAEEPYSPENEFALHRFYENREDSFEKTTKSFYSAHVLPNDCKRNRPATNQIFDETVDDALLNVQTEEGHDAFFRPNKKFKRYGEDAFS